MEISRKHQKYSIIYLLNSCHFHLPKMVFWFKIKLEICCKCRVPWNSPILLHALAWLAALHANSSFEYETSVHYYLGIFHLLILEMKILWILACIIVSYLYTGTVSNERIGQNHTVHGFVIQIGNAVYEEIQYAVLLILGVAAAIRIS